MILTANNNNFYHWQNNNSIRDDAAHRNRIIGKKRKSKTTVYFFIVVYLLYLCIVFCQHGPLVIKWKNKPAVFIHQFKKVQLETLSLKCNVPVLNLAVI
jgi:hypothetical protein